MSIFDPCNDVDNCPVHFRNDMLKCNDTEFAAITYLGEYCVYSDVRPPSLSELGRALLTGSPLVLDYFTTVYRVGQGALSDVEGTENEHPVADMIRTTANEAEDLHDETVQAIKDDVMESFLMQATAL